MANFEMHGIETGYFIRWDKSDSFHHRLGGANQVKGSDCPNCGRLLILYMTIDCSDPRLGLEESGVAALPLLYCMRCALCWSDFVYRIESSDSISIQDFSEGPDMPEWYEAVGGDQFRQKPVSLVEIPVPIEKLLLKLNSSAKLSEKEVLEFAAATGHFASPDVGGYPIVDVTNQISGRAFLQQRLDDPCCEGCGRKMTLLAALCNDRRHDIKIVYDGGQVVFYICKPCRSINVQSSA